MLNTIELSQRHGFAIDRAERCLAHAIAIVNDDWLEAQKMARAQRDDAIERNADLPVDRMYLAVVGALDHSRETLPV